MPNSLINAMADAAVKFLDGLDDVQRGRATRPFSNEAERTEWYFTPNARPGIPLLELDSQQRQRARQLLHAGLSEGGYNTAALIMGLEAILDPVERWNPNPYLGYDRTVPSIWRDPETYFACVFGNPAGARWGWSFGGHHVSVHYTVSGDELSANPLFFGAHPAISPLQPGFLLEPLKAERKLGLELLHLLDPGQRETAVLLPRAPYDMIQVNRPKVTEGALPLPPWIIMGKKAVPEEFYERNKRGWERQFAHLPLKDEELEPLRYTAAPKGLPGAAMNAGQREAFRELLDVYLKRVPDEAAAAHMARVTGNLGAFHFAWAGGDTELSAHYYRIQGPRMLIEYDSPFEDGCHIHAAWRDPEGDFGMDILARHYAAAHV